MMFNQIPKSVKSAFCAISLILVCFSAKSADAPFTVTDGLFDQSKTNDLGLSRAEGTETYTIFAPTASTDKFSNGAVIIGFKSKLYCMWQSSAKDEDAADTWVAYSTSVDGVAWSTPDTIIAPIDSGYCSSGGWWATEDTLVAYINLWPSRISPRGGYTYCKTSTDGSTWSAITPVLMEDGSILDGIFEQDPHALPSGRIINAAHFQTGININPIYTDDPLGIRNWTKGKFTSLDYGSVSREIEPSSFLRNDGTAVMIFRDQNSTFLKLASVSTDQGENWTQALLTDMPDARTKQSAGNLPNGDAFMTGNPVNNKLRIPLAVTLSEDGMVFNTAYLLREGGDSIPTLRYEGKAKRSGYHYPKSYVWKDYLCVSYTTNKEDVQYTRVPLSSLILNSLSVEDNLENQNEDIEISVNSNRQLLIVQNTILTKATVNIYSINGQFLQSSSITKQKSYINLNNYSNDVYIIEVISENNRYTKRIIVS